MKIVSQRILRPLVVSFMGSAYRSRDDCQPPDMRKAPAEARALALLTHGTAIISLLGYSCS